MVSAKEDDIKTQVNALWQATFGDQPSVTADAGMMLSILVTCLPDVGPWSPKPWNHAPRQTAAPSGDLERLEDS
jgi:hypothetical protein